MIEEDQDYEGSYRSQDLNILDRQTGKPRLCQEMCETCVFRPGNLMHLRPGRLKDMVNGALKEGSYIICHSTLPGAKNPEHKQAAVCQGFYENFADQSNLLRVYARLGGFEKVV